MCEVNFKDSRMLECSDEAAVQMLSDFVLKKSLKNTKTCESVSECSNIGRAQDM